tara:strand:- start:5 stop:445 length:441 start_codon:yes stop_codon:yes gene_type:complete
MSFSVGSLFSLSLDTKPLWGSLSSQEMIEHLLFSVRVSSGKIESKIITPKEKIKKAVSFLHSKKPLPKNIVVPFFKKPPPLVFSSIKKSVSVLEKELLYFHLFFKKNPTKKIAHPIFGWLSYKEWCLLHEKHFRHHFEQFGLSFLF